MGIALLTSVSFTVFAEDDADYCYDEGAFVMMTPEEVSAKMLELGIGLDRVSVYSGAIDDVFFYVSKDYTYKRIEVFFYTGATMVANEIGMRNIKLYERYYTGETLLRTDAKFYTGFKDYYSGGYYYTEPVGGREYYAKGIHYAIFTVTERIISNTSNSVEY